MRVFMDLRPFEMCGHFRSMAGRVRGFGLVMMAGLLFVHLVRSCGGAGAGVRDSVRGRSR